jgi:hypothetical protein
VHVPLKFGVQYKRIAEFLGLTLHQVHYAATHRLTPQHHHAGPSPLLDSLCQRQLMEWIHKSPFHRLTKWADIPRALDLGISHREDAVTTALRMEGRGRYVSKRRPPLSEKKQEERRESAFETVDWAPKWWGKMLWSNETWVTGGVHTEMGYSRER